MAGTDRLTRTGFLAIVFGALLLLGAAVLRRRHDEVGPADTQ